MVRANPRPAPAPCGIELSGRLPKALGLARREICAAARAFAALSSRRCGEIFRHVAVIIQDDAESDAVHAAVMGVSGPTDVITQRYDPMPHEEPGVYGEIYINARRALKCSRASWSARQEFLLYLAHGMDHLSGADDHSPADYARMRRRELAWLRALHQ